MAGLVKRVARPWLLPAARLLGLRPPLAPSIRPEERLSPGEVPTRVTIREDETLLVNGRPFFPLGLYYAESELRDASGAGLRALRAIGFNTVFIHGAPDPEILDRVADAGLYVWCRPPGELHGGLYALRKLVPRLARHRALLVWEMDDEPLLNQPSFEAMRAGCRLVRQIDRFHPILCTQWFGGSQRLDEVARWGTLCDLHGFGTYPVPLSRFLARQHARDPAMPDSLSAVGAQVALWRRLAPGKPVVPALQAFASDSLADGSAGFPTVAESRFMAYHAIVNGAKGLRYFGVVTPDAPHLACGIPPQIGTDLEQTHRDYLATHAANAAFLEQHVVVTQELSRMAGVFTSVDAAEETTVPADESREVAVRVKTYDGEPIVLAVNAGEKEAGIGVTVPAWRNRQVNVWRERRGITADDHGRIADSVEPFGVRIYSSAPDLLTN